MRPLCLSSLRSGVLIFFFFQAEDGIRDLVRSRGLGDVYKRQLLTALAPNAPVVSGTNAYFTQLNRGRPPVGLLDGCLLYTSDAADERSSVDLGGRRIIKKKTSDYQAVHA